MFERQLIGALTPDPRSWPVRLDAQRSPDWPAVMVLAQRHKVSGLLISSLTETGQLDRVPVTVANLLRDQVIAAGMNHDELGSALRELASFDDQLVARAVALKGSATLEHWPDPAHRPMSDIDLLFTADDFPSAESNLLQLGFWRKESLNGPTYYRDRPGRRDPLCLDLHVAGPSKYWRPDSALKDWTEWTEPLSLHGVELRRLPVEHHLVNVVTHLHEHLGSWIHALADDDLALVRLLDVELIVQGREPDPLNVWRFAVEHELQGEFALGLWVQAQLRGSLPTSLDPLAELVDLVADLGEKVALPGGGVSTWPVPILDRVYMSDRVGLCFETFDDAGVRGADVGIEDVHSIAAWKSWYKHRGSLPEFREQVELLGGMARERVSNFMPSSR